MQQTSARDSSFDWGSALAFDEGRSSSGKDLEPSVAVDSTANRSAPESQQPEKYTPLPPHNSGPPDKIWSEFFSAHQADPVALRRIVLRLTTLEQHEHVIHLLQSALINGQTQPWMYEVLAESMKFAGRPDAEVQRVILSMTDFGAANFETMMISGAYLTRFDRDKTALRMYQQASRMAPQRPEPYIMGLRLARKLKQAKDVGWAAVGILSYAWTDDVATLHREAENAALEAEEWLSEAGEKDAAAKLKADIADAKRRDVQVVLTWNGTADLDLYVEEPSGSVCSFKNPETIGGGIHLHDGYGPTPDNCIETYLCPLAVAGEYKVRMRHVIGNIVGNRAQVTITTHLGSANQNVERRTVKFEEQDQVVTFRLDKGRRTSPRTVSTRHLRPEWTRNMVEATRFLNQPESLTPEEQNALRRFQQGRELSLQRNLAQTGRPFVGGAVGFQPVVTTLNEGSTLAANAIVSPDRRYVRVAVNPVFSTLTDVFTFSFVSGADPFGGRNTGLGGN